MSIFSFRKEHESFITRGKSPWLIVMLFALIPTLAIVFSLSNLNQKYLLEQKATVSYDKSKVLSYYPQGVISESLSRIDVLDFKGISACCQLYYQSTAVTDQINLYGYLPRQANLNVPVFFDANGDGIEDLFVFTQHEDSIFLNVVDLANKQLLLFGRFLTTVGGGKNTTPDFVLRPITTSDNNGDGVEELYFLINAGFVLTPRQLFCYDYANDELINSENIGGQHYVTPQSTDADSLLLVSCTLSTNNYDDEDTCLYSDTCAWLLYYDKMLKICQPALPFSGTGNNLLGPYEVNGKTFFFLSNAGTQERHDYVVAVNEDHTVTQRKLFLSLNKSSVSAVNHNGRIIYLLSGYEDGQPRLFELDFEKAMLSTTKFTRRLPQAGMIPCEVAGKIAYLGHDPVTNHALLLLDDFSQELSFSRPLTLRSYNLYFQTLTQRGQTIIYVTDQTNLYTYVLSRNKTYVYRYLWLLFIYVLSLFFVILVVRYFLMRFQKQRVLEDEIKNLQIQLVNAQLDPHLTYNVLNLVSSKVLVGDRLEAYDLITSFSKLMRSALLFSKEVTWTIEEELIFIENYKAIMILRFADKFDLEIDNFLSADMSATQIPRLLLQNAVENSIKHAFVGWTVKGLIRIVLTVENDIIQISIIDNGMGIVNAKKNRNDSKSTGKGVSINKRQIDLFNKLYKTHLTYTVEQVNDNGGTVVSIFVPRFLN